MSLLGLGVEVTIFGIVVSFCQFWTTVLTKNGDFLCGKKKSVRWPDEGKGVNFILFLLVGYLQ